MNNAILWGQRSVMGKKEDPETLDILLFVKIPLRIDDPYYAEYLCSLTINRHPSLLGELKRLVKLIESRLEKSSPHCITVVDYDKSLIEIFQSPFAYSYSLVVCLRTRFIM
jgi:hypothetical protein